MKLRITRVFAPISGVAGFILSELGVSPTDIALASFGIALASMLLFLFAFTIPLLSPAAALSLATGLSFLNGLLDDVGKKVEVRRRRRSALGGPLGTFIGDFSDAFIVLGALLYLSLKQTYYNFGRLPFIDLSYVEPGLRGHLGLGFVLIAGCLALGHVGSEEKMPALAARSERMYIFSIFGALGIATGLFSGMIFTGLLMLTLLTYLTLLGHMLSSKKRQRSRVLLGLRRLGQRAVSTSFSAIRGALKTFLRAIGLLLLSLYILVEKVYLALRKVFGKAMPASRETSLTAQEAPERSPAQSTAAIPPSPSSLSFPPPERLMEGSQAYTAEEEVGESMLVEYEPVERKEEAVAEIVEFMIAEGKDVVIAATEPASSYYAQRFDRREGLRIIELSEQGSMPGANTIPMTNLEYFSQVFEELDERHVLIFESLSNLMLQIGVAQAYRFISQALTQLSRQGVTFIVFINRLGHEEKDISNFENLFMNIAEIKGGRLRKVR